MYPQALAACHVFTSCSGWPHTPADRHSRRGALAPHHTVSEELTISDYKAEHTDAIHTQAAVLGRLVTAEGPGAATLQQPSVTVLYSDEQLCVPRCLMCVLDHPEATTRSHPCHITGRRARTHFHTGLLAEGRLPLCTRASDSTGLDLMPPSHAHHIRQ